MNINAIRYFVAHQRGSTTVVGISMIEVLSRLWLLLTALWVMFVLVLTLLVLSDGGRFDAGIFSIRLLGPPLIVVALGAALVWAIRGFRQQ
jgi:predicted membrane protein